jgi:ABC-type antimicrobial peptide transport system permease subunit
VAEQLREYGIRLMLGASPVDLSRAIVLGGLGTTAIGLVVGIGAAAAMGKTVNSVLFQVEPRDVTSYALVTAVIVAAAIGAAVGPARRVGRVDPAALLRAE